MRDQRPKILTHREMIEFAEKFKNRPSSERLPKLIEMIHKEQEKISLHQRKIDIWRNTARKTKKYALLTTAFPITAFAIFALNITDIALSGGIITSAFPILYGIIYQDFKNAHAKEQEKLRNAQETHEKYLQSLPSLQELEPPQMSALLKLVGPATEFNGGQRPEQMPAPIQQPSPKKGQNYERR